MPSILPCSIAHPCGGQRFVFYRSQHGRARCDRSSVLNWTATARANATPSQVLEVLTHPEEIRRWSPVEFDLDDLDGRRLAAGTRGRVTGRVAGVPVGLDVRYELGLDEVGAELTASVSMRRRSGLTGRFVANATAALLSAGALEGAAGRIARVAESQSTIAAA